MARKSKSGEHDKDNDHEVEREDEDKLEVVDKAERATVREQVAGQPYEGRATLELLETTDAEDIDLLAQAIVTLIQDPAYDDMTWPEVDRALRLASHQVKQNWAATGSVKPAPPPEPEVETARDEKDGDKRPAYQGN